MASDGRADDSALSQRVADAFRAACRAELTALKPGNVHIFAPGHRMTVADFERSAEVAAPFIAEAGAGVGQRVLGAMRATLVAVGQNTNLGILLLCAPMARAAEQGGNLVEALRRVLADLTLEDARDVYAAIAAANPGGLGAVPEHDVTTAPVVPLSVGMGAAQARDRIARQYVTGFSDLIDLGLPIFDSEPAVPSSGAVTRLYLTWLAAFPDSHVARKYGAKRAEALREEVRALAIGPDRDVNQRLLMNLDARWKSEGINPGTSADLTVATIFLHILSHSK